MWIFFYKLDYLFGDFFWGKKSSHNLKNIKNKSGFLKVLIVIFVFKCTSISGFTGVYNFQAFCKNSSNYFVWLVCRGHYHASFLFTDHLVCVLHVNVENVELLKSSGVVNFPGKCNFHVFHIVTTLKYITVNARTLKIHKWQRMKGNREFCNSSTGFRFPSALVVVHNRKLACTDC